jgi:hypothetical protein
MARRRRPRRKRLDETPFVRDLARVLSRDQAVYLRLGPEGAVMSVKSAETFAEGEAIGTEWLGMTPEERARAVFGWIRKAAKYSRNPRVRWMPA